MFCSILVADFRLVEEFFSVSGFILWMLKIGLAAVISGSR